MVAASACVADGEDGAAGEVAGAVGTRVSERRVASTSRSISDADW
jgi:hypothetical protein